jgi:hypothetical protein
MTQAELLDVFALTGELLTREESDPTVTELCNVAGRMAFELLRVSEAPATALNEPVVPPLREKGLSAADASSSTDQSPAVSVELSTISSTPSTPSTSRPKRKRDWAAIKRRQRAKQRASPTVEPEPRP